MHFTPLVAHKFHTLILAICSVTSFLHGIFYLQSMPSASYLQNTHYIFFYFHEYIFYPVNQHQNKFFNYFNTLTFGAITVPKNNIPVFKNNGAISLS